MKPKRNEQDYRRAKKVADIYKGMGHLVGDKFIQNIKHNRKKCSCDMCCNRRKIEGKTLQEKKVDLDFKEQLKDEI